MTAFLFWVSLLKALLLASFNTAVMIVKPYSIKVTRLICSYFQPKQKEMSFPYDNIIMVDSISLNLISSQHLVCALCQPGLDFPYACNDRSTAVPPHSTSEPRQTISSKYANIFPEKNPSWWNGRQPPTQVI